jgi:hypothetical protein
MPETIIGNKNKETDESIKTRMTNCQNEIEKLLEKYNCSLQVNQSVGVMPLKND